MGCASILSESKGQSKDTGGNNEASKNQRFHCAGAGEQYIEPAGIKADEAIQDGHSDDPPYRS